MARQGKMKLVLLQLQDQLPDWEVNWEMLDAVETVQVANNFEINWLKDSKSQTTSYLFTFKPKGKEKKCHNFILNCSVFNKMKYNSIALMLKAALDQVIKT
jgi:hypothetical protein